MWIITQNPLKAKASYRFQMYIIHATSFFNYYLIHKKSCSSKTASNNSQIRAISLFLVYEQGQQNYLVSTMAGIWIWHSTSTETGMWGTVTSCHAGYQQVNRCHTRGECQGKYIIYTPLPNMTKVAHSGFETQRRHHQKSKTGVSVVT